MVSQSAVEGFREVVVGDLHDFLLVLRVGDEFVELRFPGRAVERELHGAVDERGVEEDVGEFDGTPLIAPGDHGLGSVELANVLLYSSLIESPVNLPLDGAAWEKKLNELIAGSKLEKKVVKIANDDFTKSFHR